MDASSIGILYGAGNIGFVIGAVAVGAVTARIGVGPALIVSGVGGAVATAILPFATGGLAVPVLFLGRFVGAVTIPVFNVNARALRQTRAPRAALGRVNSVFRLIDWGTLPIGALLGGWIGTVYGLHNTLVMAAVLGAASAAWLVVSPLWRVRHLDAPAESETDSLEPSSASWAAWHLGAGGLRHVARSAWSAAVWPTAVLRRLPSVRWAWLAIFGAVTQLAISVPAINTQMGAAPPFLYVLSVAAVLVCVLGNLRIPGLAIAALGGLLNIAAIIANGGYMPIDPAAARAVGHVPPTGYSHTVEATALYLQPLTDIIIVPPPLPFSNVYSIGDLLIVVGLAVTLATAAHGWNRVQPLRAGLTAQPEPNESTGQWRPADL
jgi:MFS family permease